MLHVCVAAQVHDCADGIGDQQALETEDYGNIVYNNGWVSTCDRNHGHGMYLLRVI